MKQCVECHESIPPLQDFAFWGIEPLCYGCFEAMTKTPDPDLVVVENKGDDEE